GKHVYCEKPLSHTVPEARALAKLAAKNKLATQMGTQIHASDNYRRVVELIQGGVIGKVTAVHNWCNKGWSDGRFVVSKNPPPKNLDWDLWLGPAKERPYCEKIHPANWRRFWEYGSGTFGDMACHVMDLPFWALNLRHPVSVACEGPEVHPDGAPAWAKATYEFPGKDGQPLTMTWSDGGAHFDLVKETKDHDGKPLSSWGLGILFVGDKGMLAADYGRRQLLPQDKFTDFKAPEQTIPNSIGHWHEWVQACKTGSATTCNFDYSGALAETVLLGIVAFRSGEKLAWDAQNLRATNTPKAEEFLHKKYRKGFEVVGL
ncbi:MAG TPA: Gfo/Idh/MocA family oxidoreductase, partial [Pirellulaceae bacterium]|nr:Gfo/Idh/MocA family oxidoreductase [Pirellulaceae bacterium]